MRQSPSRKIRPVARPVRARRQQLIDSLEPRVMMAANAETKWMITAAGGTAPPSPAMTVTENLGDVNGYPKTPDPAALTLNINTAAATVKVNGVPASVSPIPEIGWTLTNTNNVLGLSPGINRIQVRSYDSSNVELTRKTLDVWYDDGNVQTVSGTLAGNNTWTAAGGPYQVSANVTIPAGSSLTIEPGTSVYMGAGVNFVINGKLTANGTDFKHIRVTRVPGAGDWADMEFRSTQQDNRMSYVDYEYARNQPTGSTIDQGMRVDLSKVFLDHIHFDNIGRQYIDITNSSIELRHSIVPSASGVELIHGASMLASANSTFAVFDGNVLGTNTGYNDVIDFTGGNRPGAIVQFLNNWLLGSQDDGFDLDSTDAWIEGNVFMHFHQPNGRSTPESKSHAVSTGNDTGDTSEITVVRNFFYDVDHALVIKDGASGTIVNNTIVKVATLPGATQASTAVINLYEVRSGQYQANRLHIEGNIIRDVSRMFELPQPFAAGHPEIIQINMARNILPDAVTYPTAGANITFGPGNVSVDPQFVNATATDVLDPTAELALQPKSPAIGAGPNGVDMGAAIPSGVSLSGEPASPTKNKNVTLTPGFLFGTGTNAAGYVSYKYRINNGAYGPETPLGTPITLTNLADGTYTIYAIGKNDAGTWQSESAPTASNTFTIDTTPPKVTSSVFHYETPVHSIAVDFSEPVVVSLFEADPTLTNLTTGAVLRGNDIQWSPGVDGHGAVITFPNLPNGRLPEGRYQLTLHAAGVHDIAGNPLDGNSDGSGGDDFPFPTFFKVGDLNHDGIVDFADLVILAQNYGGTGKTFGEGNLDYDPAGNVDFADLVILAQQYGTALPAAASVVAAQERTAPVQNSNKGLFQSPPTPAKKPAPRKSFGTRRI
jgi:hypothetical protein